MWLKFAKNQDSSRFSNGFYLIYLENNKLGFDNKIVKVENKPKNKK